MENLAKVFTCNSGLGPTGGYIVCHVEQVILKSLRQKSKAYKHNFSVVLSLEDVWRGQNLYESLSRDH